jgi:hemerythrin-like metal-binding protein
MGGQIMDKMLIWESQYCVGLEGIDANRKNLFDKMNEFLSVLYSGNTLQELLKALDNLEKHIDDYFKYEESLQIRTKFLAYHVHIKDHDEFRYKLSELRVQLESNQINKTIILNLQHNIDDWWKNHILYWDSEFIKYIFSIGLY